MSIDKLMSNQKKNINDAIHDTFDSIIELSKKPEKINRIKNGSALIRIKDKKAFVSYKDVEIREDFLVIKKRKKGKLMFI